MHEPEPEYRVALAGGADGRDAVRVALDAQLPLQAGQRDLATGLRQCALRIPAQRAGHGGQHKQQRQRQAACPSFHRR
jgi:hypothetical protein